MLDAIARWTGTPLGHAMAIPEGAVLGLIFYAGLWWTVNRTASFRWPALSVLTSLLVRTGVALAGFYLVASGDWERLLLCLMGFMVGRAGVTWWTRVPASSSTRSIAAVTGVPRAP